MSSEEASCARTRTWNWDSKRLDRYVSKSSSSEEKMSFDLENSEKRDVSSDSGSGSELLERGFVDLGDDPTGLNVSESSKNIKGYVFADNSKLSGDIEYEKMHIAYTQPEVTAGSPPDDFTQKTVKHKDERKKKGKDNEKHSKRKDKSKDNHSTRESKRRKEDADDKKSHSRQKKSEKSHKWEREDSDTHTREKHRAKDDEKREKLRDDEKKDKHRDDEQKEKHRDDDYLEHDSFRPNKLLQSRSNYHKGGKDREKDVKRTRLDIEQRSNRTRSRSRSPPKASKAGRSPSPQYKEDNRGWSSREKEGGSRYRRSGLGGYSPRRRRSDAAVRTPSPPARSPERKKTRAWDLPPVGMDSGVAAAMVAVHQVAAQQAAALASVSSLAMMNPALATVSLTQSTRNLRRLYIGNVPASVSEGELLEFINSAMVSANAIHLHRTQPCINCMVNVEKSYAFAEFLTPEDATAGLALDGITLHGTTLKIRRPRDYVPPPNGGMDITPVVGMVSSIVRDSPHKVFVGGICKTLTAEMLKEIVTAFGQLKAYHWQIAVNGSRIEAYAFLEYLDPSVTLKACAGLNGLRLGSSVITVVQATPNACIESDGKQPPFYGVPEHAKTLLQAPTCILELQNVVTKEEALSMSEADFIEIEEDVRIECGRFGTVKSTHIVKTQMTSDNDSQKTLGEVEAAGKFSLQIQQEYRTEDVLVQEGKVQKVQPPGGDATEPSAQHGNEVKQMQITIEPTAGAMNEYMQSQMEMVGVALGDRNQAHAIQDSGSCEHVKIGLSAIHRDIYEPLVEKNDTLHAISESIQVVTDGLKLPNDLDISQAASDAVNNINLGMGDSDIGKVFVEFTREECACQAAHALHGRLYANRPVIAGYYPLNMYQKKFKKALEPSTHEERQILALAAHKRLNSLIPEKD
ncbi:hypothetical protein KP509_15G031000 [Ceratopteris richardii]|uniref:RRM domain-containing protein n=1 Tax=Ceratopteris richardii TaxID=49495 RepID=A0A8T2T6X4_CERRI|nr:hypothetical protein KP509_15G031000 [Ceratopteris richardii]